MRILRLHIQTMNLNFQRELEKITESLTDRPRLLLHSCCAPCSSYCLIYLLTHFDITCFYYNPNITDEDEYRKRVAELNRLVDILNEEYCSAASGNIPIKVTEGEREPEVFLQRVESAGLADCPEGGKRCEMCFGMRLAKTYEKAAGLGFDYFTTTLTISPLKDAKLINRIGYSIAEQSKNGGPQWLPSDFKKKDGYRQSIELSRKYDLYRQNFCGCDMSRR